MSKPMIKGTGHLWYYCKRPIFSLWVSHRCINNKSLKILAQLVIEDARGYTLVTQIGVLSDAIFKKGFGPDVFEYLSEKLPLSQKVCHLRGSRFSLCFMQAPALSCSLQIVFILTFFWNN